MPDRKLQGASRACLALVDASTGAICSQPGYVLLSMNDSRSVLVDALREGGHAVVDELGISACRCGDLLDRAARFIDAALTVAGANRSGRAYIRLSCSSGLLFVEVTRLSPGTFDALMVDDAAMNALEELRAWARESAQALRTERGPRDQFRITVVLEPGSLVDSPGCATRQDCIVSEARNNRIGAAR
jgi:hypothetical protein